MRRGTLRRLLSTWFLVILLGILIGLGGAAYVMLGQYLVRSGQVRLLTMAVTGLNRSNEPIEGTEADDEDGSRHPFRVQDDFEPSAQRMAESIGSRFLLARITTPDGRILGVSQTGARAPGVDAARLAQLRERFEERRQAGRKKGRATVAYFEGSPGRKWQVLLLPLQRDGELAGVLQVAQRWREQEDLLATVGLYLACGGLLAIACGLLASWWLSRRIARPLEALAETTRRVAAGDLSARARLGAGGHEVYDVAEAFDEMVSRLESSFEAQRRFVADASHELKTPLTAIGGMAELLRTGAADATPEKRAHALDTIEREVDKMSRLVSDLLILSRTDEPDGGGLELERVDVRGLIEEAASDAHVAGRDHDFTVECARDLYVEGNRDRLARVLRNLIDNAFKYTPAGGSVSLRGRHEGRDVVVEVSDTGVGIAAEDLPHVFDRFYRADPSRTRRTGGSGLGLAIVRALVEQHGGTVALESSVGKGTLARVRLPALHT